MKSIQTTLKSLALLLVATVFIHCSSSTNKQKNKKSFLKRKFKLLTKTHFSTVKPWRVGKLLNSVPRDRFWFPVGKLF